MRLRRGQAFTEGEAAPSVVVNETFVKRFFPSEEPMGRRVRLDATGPWFTIVGIAADVRGQGAREDTRAEMFIPFWQVTERGIAVILKSDSSPQGLIAPLKAAVASIDPGVPVAGIAVLSDRVRESIDQPRFFAMLAMAFAVLAVTLAAIGIYGVMAYVVAQRTTEIGVRMALGATSSEVFRLVLGDGLKITAIGVVAGIAGSLLMARWMTALLFEVTPGDPATLAATAGALLLVAAAACFIPARRATRVDPMVALRAE
jgi:predicted permease